LFSPYKLNLVLIRSSFIEFLNCIFASILSIYCLVIFSADGSGFSLIKILISSLNDSSYIDDSESRIREEVHPGITSSKLLQLFLISRKAEDAFLVFESKVAIIYGKSAPLID
jgi:hypothetical protein